jgi:hypothetical protein
MKIVKDICDRFIISIYIKGEYREEVDVCLALEDTYGE